MLKYGTRNYPAEQKEATRKYLVKLENKRRTLAARPSFYIVRFEGYEFKVYFSDPEIDGMVSEVKKILPFGITLPEAFLGDTVVVEEEEEPTVTLVEVQDAKDEGYESE